MMSLPQSNTDENQLTASPFEGIDPSNIIPLLIDLPAIDCYKNRAFFKSYSKWESLSTDQRDKTVSFWQNLSPDVRLQLVNAAKAQRDTVSLRFFV
jgi:hypothetical protein